MLILKKFLIGLFIVIIASIQSCKPKDNEDNLSTTVDRTPYLTTMADSIITPSFKSLNEQMLLSETAMNNFVSSPTLSTLQTAREALLQSWHKWQAVAYYDFGPSNTYYLSTSIDNLFPVDTNAIQNAIKSGIYNFTISSGAKISGFGAMDFILYTQTWTDQQIVDSIQNNPNRGKYLKDVHTFLKNKINSVYNEWNTTYRATFIAANGIDAGSSFSSLVNKLIREIEIVKNFKVGIPVNIVGNILIDEVTGRPFEAEACYSDSSLALLKSSLVGAYNIYFGINTNNKNGLGLDDYLIQLGNQPLNNQIKLQFDEVFVKLAAIQSPYSAAVNNAGNRIAVRELHASLVMLISYLKVDYASATGVMINYADTDGD
jgi:predicted lipoprotein